MLFFRKLFFAAEVEFRYFEKRPSLSGRVQYRVPMALCAFVAVRQAFARQRKK
jgi:hypothetical protein